MRLSKYFFHTLKESPGDAEIESHRLMIRANFIKKLAPGIYSYLPLGLRSIRKFENIVRAEMNRAGALELLMPMVQPKELWDETGRWSSMGKGLLKFKDRNDHEMCLGATHEEVITDIARREVKSYRDLPLNLYQVQTKYRDEVRPRFGLMRGKEFIMKDAYSFDVSKDMALKSYDVMFEAYRRIFTSCALDFRTVKADSGAIGGSHTHEFQVLANSGEDQIMACDTCDYASNIEITPSLERAALDSAGADHVGDHVAVGGSVSSGAGVLSALGLTRVAEDGFSIFVPDGARLAEGAVALAKQKLGTLQNSPQSKIEAFLTPGLKTIDGLAAFLRRPSSQLAKTLFYKIADNKFIAVMLRGDDEMNEIKLKNLYDLPQAPELAHEGDVLRLTGAHPGSCGPVGLSVAVVSDLGLKNLKDWVVGANVDDVHVMGVNPDIDFKVARWADLRKARAGDVCPECKKGKLASHRGIEVGHVFYLGQKYSKALKATFLDEKQKESYCEMGCYGIGIGRTVQAAIEQNHDKDGMIWPLPLAPFQVMICLLDVLDESTKTVAENLYLDLESRGIEVLLDDRDERPGSKFKDADLLGLPLRINVGKKSLADQNQVEIIERKTKTLTKIKAPVAADFVVRWLRSQFASYEDRLRALGDAKK